MGRSISRLLGGCAILVTVGAAHAACAADVAPQGSAAEDASVGEIVVTANKRQQNLNDVGLSIAAVSGEQLKERNVSSLADIAQAVPGLTYTNTQQNTPVYTLRGVGFYETSLAAYPTTSVYVDEAPLPFSVMTTQTAFDLERIEVLKGPQGTLFGNNATGGAINFIAAKPTRDFAGEAALSYGRFNTKTFEGFLSGPLAPNLLGRIAVKASDGDEWQRSYTRNDRSGKTRFYAVRGLLDWQASERLRFQLNVNAWKDKGDTQAPQFVVATPQQPGTVLPRVVNYPIPPRNSRAADWSPEFPPSANNRLFQAVLRTDLELSDDVTATALTSIARFRQNQSVEGDATDQLLQNIQSNYGRIHSFSQELRLANAASNAFRWIVGGNYASDNVTEIDHLRYDNSSTGYALGISQLYFQTTQRMKNYAAFGNVEYDLGDVITIKAGARYTKADRVGSFCSSDPDTGLINVFFTGLSSALSGTTVAPIAANECFALDANSLPSRVPVVNKLREENLSWRLGVDWKPSDDILVYANVNKGYKAGSFPTLSASTTVQYAGVKQESVLAYELGAKAQVNRTTSITVAGYYYDYSNKQLKSKFLDPIFGPIDVLQNIPKSSVRGAELEILSRPVRGLSLSGTVVYSDAKIDRFVGVNGAGTVSNFKGARVPYTPKWRASADASYSWELNENLGMFVGGSYTYQTRSTTTIGGVDPFVIRGYGVLDLRGGISGPDNVWRLELWGKNVSNKFYSTNIVQGGGSDTIIRYTGRPATYGATIRYKF